MFNFYLINCFKRHFARKMEDYERMFRSVSGVWLKYSECDLTGTWESTESIILSLTIYWFCFRGAGNARRKRQSIMHLLPPFSSKNISTFHIPPYCPQWNIALYIYSCNTHTICNLRYILLFGQISCTVVRFCADLIRIISGAVTIRETVPRSYACFYAVKRPISRRIFADALHKTCHECERLARKWREEFANDFSRKRLSFGWLSTRDLLSTFAFRDTDLPSCRKYARKL